MTTYYLFESASKSTAAAAHLDLEILKAAAAQQGYSVWVIRDGNSSTARLIIQGGGGTGPRQNQ